jgi:hypothetical protein
MAACEKQDFHINGVITILEAQQEEARAKTPDPEREAATCPHPLCTQCPAALFLQGCRLAPAGIGL